ncbi:hypothetical protein [Burkholderia gladioli]|uniref:hypothetical protein n=1 Tax=Burkholderia gladioli TaxID=28095 RepID=UPI000CFE5391|nr:hypothetical protein [Burkholderia gladioli]MDN7750573.1 hypothetical protein [Burkholderia gladioli]PRG92846.1 hypothetical protein C6V08_28380 [Burkholderia gladioli]
MSVSKVPAYFGLIVAVAAGVLISGEGRNTADRASRSPEVSSSQPTDEPKSSIREISRPVIWKTQTLGMGVVRLRVSAPASHDVTKCLLPNAGDHQVGVCQPVGADDGHPYWQIRTVTQRARYIPVSWFVSEIESLHALPGKTVALQLGNEANRVTNAAFSDAALVASSDIPEGTAIQGTAEGEGASKSRSCIFAYLLASNRPTTLLYCAQTPVDALSGAKTMVASLQRLNPSSEYKRGSAQATEQGLYQKRLQAFGGLSNASDLVASEQAYERASIDACRKYPAISQERYQCAEAFAATRLLSL